MYSGRSESFLGFVNPKDKSCLEGYYESEKKSDRLFEGDSILRLTFYFSARLDRRDLDGPRRAARAF